MSGTPRLGFVYEPGPRRLYWAIQEHGAYLETDGAEAVRLHVSTRNQPTTLRLVTSASLDEEQRTRLLSEVQALDAGRIRSVGCKVGLLVRDQADIYVNPHAVKIWDLCGPIVILEEAGGKLTTSAGATLSLDLNQLTVEPFVATNGTKHETVFETVRQEMDW